MNYSAQHPAVSKTVVLLLAMVSFAVCSSAGADSPIKLPARVTKLVGVARYQTNDFSWLPLHAATELSASTTIQTGALDSSIELALTDPHGGGQAIIHVCSNSAVTLARLNLRSSDTEKTKDLKLGLIAGRVWVHLDGASRYEIELIGGTGQVQLAIPRSGTAPQETLFIFRFPETLTVVKGAVNSRVGTGPENPVCAGEQVRLRDGELKKLPPDSPELRLEP